MEDWFILISEIVASTPTGLQQQDCLSRQANQKNISFDELHRMPMSQLMKYHVTVEQWASVYFREMKLRNRARWPKHRTMVLSSSSKTITFRGSRGFRKCPFLHSWNSLSDSNGDSRSENGELFCHKGRTGADDMLSRTRPNISADSTGRNETLNLHESRVRHLFQVIHSLGPQKFRSVLSR